MLSIDGLSVRYPGSGSPSLLGASVRARDGAVTGVAGASESGKTTLCLVLAGLVPRVMRASVSGSLRVDDEDVALPAIHELAGHVGLLTGSTDSLLSLVAETVFEEVAFGPANLGVPRDELIRRSWGALHATGIEALAERDPRHLSSGETQLVAIAGLLAMGTRNLVLDEPASHLDPAGTERLVSVLRRLAHDDGAAVLLASPDTRLLDRACDEVAVLHGGTLGPAGKARAVLADPRIADAGLEPLTVQPSER